MLILLNGRNAHNAVRYRDSAFFVRRNYLTSNEFHAIVERSITKYHRPRQRIFISRQFRVHSLRRIFVQGLNLTSVPNVVRRRNAADLLLPSSAKSFKVNVSH